MKIFINNLIYETKKIYFYTYFNFVCYLLFFWRTRKLKNDGFCVLYRQTISQPCIKLQEDVLSKLPTGYVFMDYIYKINDGALSTFHRDVTSSKTIYPVYTLILYKYDGELLSVCPSSNTTYPFVTSRIVNVEGKSGTCFLFDYMQDV